MNISEYQGFYEDPTHIQGLQTVPAKGMFAVLAHHLCTALVPLDVNFTFRTALDWCVIFFVLIKRAGKKRESSPMCFFFKFQTWHHSNPKSLNIHFTRRTTDAIALIRQSIFTNLRYNRIVWDGRFFPPVAVSLSALISLVLPFSVKFWLWNLEPSR